jgi:hypothetical protein
MMALNGPRVIRRARLSRREGGDYNANNILKIAKGLGVFADGPASKTIERFTG